MRIYTLFVTYIQADMYAAKCSTWTMAPRQITDVFLLKLDNIKKNFTDKNPSSLEKYLLASLRTPSIHHIADYSSSSGVDSLKLCANLIQKT